MSVVLNEFNFHNEVTKNTDDVVLVDVYAAWCGPCRAVAPIIERLNGIPGVKVCKMDMDDAYDFCVSQGIQSLPTLLFYKKGQVVHKIVGVTSEETLRAKLEELKGAK